MRALAALAHDTRLGAFRFLVERGPGGAHVGEIGEALNVPPATLSFHLKHLSAAGLVRTAQRGRFIRCEADFGAIDALVRYLTDNCCGGRPERCAPLSAAAGAEDCGAAPGVHARDR